MGSVEIQGKEFRIEDIFDDHFAFTIPRYQRPYAWTEEEAADLLSDLISAAKVEDNVQIEAVDPYFIGSIVLIKETAPDSEIVDGQQRLATLTILLSVLRYCLGEGQSEGIEEFLIEKGNPILETPDRPRLTLRERDQVFFERYIISSDGIEKLKGMANISLSDAQKNMRDNALFFVKELEKLEASQLLLLAKFIVRRCYMVIVWTPDLDSAYKIFSVLNDRGLELYHSDILKAELIGKIAEDEQDSYSKLWEDAEEQLGRESFKDLFSNIRMIFLKNKPKQNILSEFRDNILPGRDSKEFINEVLIPMSDAYYTIDRVNYIATKSSSEVNNLLGWLKYIDNTDWIPPAIAYMIQNRNDPDVILRFLVDLDRLAYGLSIIRANINIRFDRYGQLLRAVDSGADLFTDDSPLQLTDDERGRIRRNLDGDIYNVVRIRKPVLMRLDAALSEGEAQYNYRVVTVEHVLPQNPPEKSRWLEWFPDDEERSITTHRLGNLVLLSRSKNSSAQNYDFDVKKEKYFKASGISPFALTTQVLAESEWTPEVFERRQKELLDKLIELWRL